MKRLAWLAVLGLMVAGCSGGGASSYEELLQSQMNVMEEMLDVLEGVTDEASAEKATPEVEAMGNKLAELATQMKELPRPSVEEMQALTEKHRERLEGFQERATTQMMKLAQYESLRDGFMRAMSNLK